MSGPRDPLARFGEGPLSRIAALVHTLLVVELLLVVTTAPTLVVLVLLDRDASNVPLAALAAVPVGPALSAALFALRRRRDLADLRPAALFWRGYRLNAAGVLRVWVPLLAGLTVVGITLANLDVAGVPGWWAWLLLAVAVVACLWGVNALVITSLFAFRARDVSRLAAYFLGRTPGVTLANACLLAVAAGVVVLSSEAVLALLGSVLALAVLHGCLPMIAGIEKDFVG